MAIIYVYLKIIDSHREQVTLLENEQIIQDNNRLYHTAISILFQAKVFTKYVLKGRPVNNSVIASYIQSNLR